MKMALECHRIENAGEIAAFRTLAALRVPYPHPLTFQFPWPADQGLTDLLLRDCKQRLTRSFPSDRSIGHPQTSLRLQYSTFTRKPQRGCRDDAAHFADLYTRSFAGGLIWCTSSSLRFSTRRALSNHPNGDRHKANAIPAPSNANQTVESNVFFIRHAFGALLRVDADTVVWP